ncbi:MAG: hypothetical protein AABX63_01595 [Nanoarchaeota archaeon]
MSKVKETLVELILRNFIEINAHKTKKYIKNQFSKRANKRISWQKSSIAAIIRNIAANSIINNENTSEGENENLEIAAEQESEDKEEKPVHGGYGTIKAYTGISPSVKYTDYGKIWSHLGAFRTYRMFEHLDDVSNAVLANGESSREMISSETQMKAARNFKYFMRTATMEAHADYMTVVSMVPPFGLGIDSKEWEKYLLMMKMSIYQPLLRLNARMA